MPRAVKNNISIAQWARVRKIQVSGYLPKTVLEEMRMWTNYSIFRAGFGGLLILLFSMLTTDVSLAAKAAAKENIAGLEGQPKKQSHIQKHSQPDANGQGNWPQFRGPARDNVSPDTGLLKSWPPEGPPLVWKVTSLGESISSVSVAGGRVYTQGHIDGEEIVFCLDEETGQKLWAVAIGPAEKVAYPGSRSIPTVDGGFLYVETVAGDVACMDAQTGKVVWRRHLKQDFQGRCGVWGYAESLLVDGDRVIVTPGGEDDTLVALDKRNGQVVWRVSVPPGESEYPAHKRDPVSGAGVAAYCSVIVAEVGGVRQYIQFLQRGIVGIRAYDGEFLWREESSASNFANCPTSILHDGYVFSSSGWKGPTGWKGAALIQLIPQGRRTTARLVYASTAMRNQYGGFVLQDGYVYGGTNGALTCVDFLSGKMMWKDSSVGIGSLVCADGHIYMRGDKGAVALIEATPEGYRERGRFELERSGRPVRAYPVVTGGRLYLRDENLLFCYNVRAKTVLGKMN